MGAAGATRHYAASMAPPGAGGTLEVRLIGKVAVRTTAGWRDDWPRPAARRLMALLALSPTRSLPREVVADRLFGHLPADRGLRNVSKALSQARTVVGPGVLQGDSTSVWISRTTTVLTDLAGDADLAQQAVTRPPPPQDWADLRACLARADHLLSEDLYEDWAQQSRREHEAATREAALALARTSRSLADWGRVLADDPCHVEAWSALLTAAAARGQGELEETYTGVPAGARERAAGTSPTCPAEPGAGPTPATGTSRRECRHGRPRGRAAMDPGPARRHGPRR